MPPPANMYSDGTSEEIVGRALADYARRHEIVLDAGSDRQKTDAVGQTLYQEGDREIVEAVAKVADARGVSRAQVALAWVARNPVVTAPIIGATKPHHLTDALAGIELQLTDDEVSQLEAPYTAHAVAGHS
ncbi:hypothetical protein Kisp02_46190 [Kineosporia sp. NBRC 101731]|nr:aldo/keto reductase [Kineosporia sp. NBRC 101731]GLY31254.1 hypothetical protein Kisp02_46190 [Kineosporia sp. NBRC 101731]